jgi:alanyl-tRNA synthetase
VRVELDWPRRFDHMQQHTGQHLLTAVAQERFDWHTTAFHLGAQVSDIELDFAGVSPEQLAELEEAVAVEIRAGRSVGSRRVSPEEYAALPVRSRGLPEGHTGDIRLVEIDGIDLNTCGGTHVHSTAEVEALALLGSEPMRGGTRVRFVAGGRLRRLVTAHEGRNAELRKLLGGPDEEFASLVAAKMDQLKETSRRIRSLEEELAVEAARSLAARERIGAAHWPQRDPAFLQRVAREFTALTPNGVALLTAGEGDAGHFLICAGEQAGIDIAKVGRAVAEILAGRGGGAGRIFQGKAGALSRRDEAFAFLRDSE